MDIGIISDIHGDLRALDYALDRLDNTHRVHQILCAGDLVGRGPDADSVVTRIRERGIITVRGNHDEWDHGLSTENAAYLTDLQLDWRGKVGNAFVFMCHGKPGNNLWGLYRDHISGTLLDMMLASLQVDVLITGHTHLPLFARVGRGVAVNPGSLYQFKSSRSTSHSYGVLNTNTLTFEVFDLNNPELVPIDDEAYSYQA
jgi:putative phosphoesterase